jgi:peptidyl-prolyl cis-trans isomerase SurA
MMPSAGPGFLPLFAPLFTPLFTPLHLPLHAVLRGLVLMAAGACIAGAAAQTSGGAAPPTQASPLPPGAAAPASGAGLRLPGASPLARPALRPGGASGSAAGGRALDRVVAVVNDEIITQTELDGRMRIAQDQMRRQNIALPPPAAFERQVLERMILDRAQLQLARETGVRVDDVTVNAAIGRMAEQNGVTVPAMRTRIEAEGMPFSRFREDLRDEITLSRLREREVDSRIQVGEGEVDNYLAEQAGVESNTVEYNVAQILLRVPEGATPDRIEAVRKQADGLLGQLRGGADFARTAATYSNASDALQGGELGWRTAERLPNLFVDAIKGLKAGDLAAVVRSPVGFHILKLAGRRDAAEGRLASGPVEQFHVRHILLRVTDLTPEPEVKRRLADLRERIVSGGQDFGAIARLHSGDPSSSRGGDLGWLYPGDVVPEFERAMKALAVNQVSEPVQTAFGWHLIQVLEKRNEQATGERTRLNAKLALRDRKSEEALQDWLRQLRDRTYVEYRLEES